MGAIFGGGGGSAPAPPPPPEPAAPSGPSQAEKNRQRRIGRAALVKSDQKGILNASTGRNVLTAV